MVIPYVLGLSALVALFPLCVFKCLRKFSSQEDAKLAAFNKWFIWFFSAVCFQMFFFKWSTRESARVHWKMHSYIGCVCLAFPHCVFSNVPSKRWHKKKHSHIDCSCLTLLHGVFSNASSNYMPQRISNYSGCICLVFLHEKFSNVSSNPLLKMSCSHIGCICSPLCIFKCVLKEPAWEEK